MTEKKRIKRDISGWLVLGKPPERCQRKCAAVSRFGSATTEDEYGWAAR